MPLSTSRYGLFTPVLIRMPGTDGWEKDATIEDVGAVARTADRLGYDHLTCSEHIGIPFAQESTRGSRYYDPLAVFGYLSAITANIRFATYVLVLHSSCNEAGLGQRQGELTWDVDGGQVML